MSLTKNDSSDGNVSADKQSCDSDFGVSKDRWAGRSVPAILVFLTITVAALAADLLSKHYVFESYLNDSVLITKAKRECDKYHQPPTSRQILYQFQKTVFWKVKFTLSTNPGVVFGWAMPRWAVAAASVFTIILVGFFFATSDRKAWPLHLALACILSGALGNLYDRFFSSVSPLGMTPILCNVRDFIDCSDLYYPWVFNIADVLLVIGVTVLAIQWIREKRQ